MCRHLRTYLLICTAISGRDIPLFSLYQYCLEAVCFEDSPCGLRLSFAISRSSPEADHTQVIIRQEENNTQTAWKYLDNLTFTYREIFFSHLHICIVNGKSPAPERCGVAMKKYNPHQTSTCNADCPLIINHFFKLRKKVWTKNRRINYKIRLRCKIVNAVITAIIIKSADVKSCML